MESMENGKWEIANRNQGLDYQQALLVADRNA
jgi:hypothetical protein